MRLFIGLIAAMSVAVPGLTMAAEGSSAAGKATAESAGCSMCHGTNGIATTPGLAADKYVPNLAAEPDLYVQFQLVFFRSGTRKSEIMNAMAKPLSDDDIRNLGAYFASLPAPKLPLSPDPAAEETAAGAKIADAIHCTNCHGDHYEGANNIPRLVGQREDYLYKALRDFKSGVRLAAGPAGMADVVYPLGDAEMKALAHFVARLR